MSAIRLIYGRANRRVTEGGPTTTTTMTTLRGTSFPRPSFFCPNSESGGRRSSSAFCFDRRGVDHHHWLSRSTLSKSRSLPPLPCNRRGFINHWRIRCLWVIDAPVKRRACKIINPLFRLALFAAAQPTPKCIPLLSLRHSFKFLYLAMIKGR